MGFRKVLCPNTAAEDPAEAYLRSEQVKARTRLLRERAALLRYTLHIKRKNSKLEKEAHAELLAEMRPTAPLTICKHKARPNKHTQHTARLCKILTAVD